MRLISLGLALFLFWLALSGHYTPALVSVGAVSALFCVLVAARMGIADGEGHPIHLAGRFLTYLPWLLVEIGKSAWGVARIIDNPALPGRPRSRHLARCGRTSC
jgi:multicomponent Na+:H+ antiporter subunit E